MKKMPADMTIKDMQQTVARWELKAGFLAESPVQKCLLLGEEMGELFKAVRSATGMTIDSKSKVAEVDEELADVMIFVAAIANRFEIDLDRAIRRKLQRNEERKWR